MASDADTGFGKEYVGGIGGTVQDHITFVVSDDVIWLC